MENAVIIFSTVAVAAILVWPRVANARLWRASITPLASIIGSGFLVLGPILQISYGAYAPLIMLGLCVVAYVFGSAIRYNIQVLDTSEDARGPLENGLESVASWALSFAYVISVAYYLNLFGAFGVSLTSVNDQYHARLLTTAVMLLILFVGWTRGFGALERMEQVSVGVKLAIITGLLVGLAIFFGQQTAAGALMVTAPTVTVWGGVTLAFGLIVTVQGFETSRYLGGTYSAGTRIRSMKLAQILSTVIYMIYIGFLAFAFDPGHFSLSETAIIDMMEIVAPILPPLLIAAALSAQFSAAVADTGGAGGLIKELTGDRVSQRQGYAVLVIAGVLLTWGADVFTIISYASRAFALYYGIQAGIAAVSAWRNGDTGKAALFAGAAALGLAIVVLGRAVE